MCWVQGLPGPFLSHPLIRGSACFWTLLYEEVPFFRPSYKRKFRILHPSNLEARSPASLASLCRFARLGSQTCTKCSYIIQPAQRRHHLHLQCFAVAFYSFPPHICPSLVLSVLLERGQTENLPIRSPRPHIKQPPWPRSACGRPAAAK